MNLSDSDRSSSNTTTPTISWEAVSGAQSYELALGTTVGGNDILDWTDIGQVTSVTRNDLSLPNAMIYASVRAVGSDGNIGQI
jgi:hypothetical protein